MKIFNFSNALTVLLLSLLSAISLFAQTFESKAASNLTGTIITDTTITDFQAGTATNVDLITNVDNVIIFKSTDRHARFERCHA